MISAAAWRTAGDASRAHRSVAGVQRLRALHDLAHPVEPLGCVGPGGKPFEHVVHIALDVGAGFGEERLVEDMVSNSASEVVQRRKARLGRVDESVKEQADVVAGSRHRHRANRESTLEECDRDGNVRVESQVCAEQPVERLVEVRASGREDRRRRSARARDSRSRNWGGTSSRA